MMNPDEAAENLAKQLAVKYRLNPATAAEYLDVTAYHSEIDCEYNLVVKSLNGDLVAFIPCQPKDTCALHIPDFVEWQQASRKLLSGEECRPADGWSLFPVDPAILLPALPRIRLKPGWRWVVFRESQGGNAMSCCFAIPHDGLPAALKWLDECIAGQMNPLDLRGLERRPPHALEHFMDAVAGDCSPESYAQASLFAREVSELGAAWHGAGWSTCRILRACTPWMVNADAWTTSVDGVRETPPPVNMTPRVAMSADQITFRFYAESDLGRAHVMEFTDFYKPGLMRPRMENRMIALHPTRGYVF